MRFGLLKPAAKKRCLAEGFATQIVNKGTRSQREDCIVKKYYAGGGVPRLPTPPVPINRPSTPLPPVTGGPPTEEPVTGVPVGGLPADAWTEAQRNECQARGGSSQFADNTFAKYRIEGGANNRVICVKTHCGNLMWDESAKRCIDWRV
jgi:hypothetical protein